MSTYTLSGDSPPAAQFIDGADVFAMPKTYISSRRGAKLAVSLTNAPHSLGKDPVAPYAIVQYAGLIEAQLVSPLTTATVLTGQPTIDPGFDGQSLSLMNVGALTFTIQDRGTLASTGLFLTATNVAIPTRNIISFVYSVSVGGWIQSSTLIPVL